MGWFSASSPVLTDEKAIQELLERGVESVIPKELALKKLRSGERMRVYLGIDPTGSKLHLGHAVPLRKLRAFSELGHQVIFLVGSFTAMIGDPTGRDAQRAALTEEQVQENFKDYKRQAGKVLDFSKIEVAYNGDWLSKLSFAEVVKLASNFTVGQMIQRDMFQKRMGEGKPIGLHEFLYPVMVGYDSVVLDVDCELGGSDQEFNMLAGRHLQERLGKREKFVLTTKLIEGLDGRKMSKTYDNCVYLDDAPGNMFGKLMALKDELLATYFECATTIPLGEIPQILSLHPKEAKLRLAREVVELYHGKDAAQSAQSDWVSTFSERKAPEQVTKVFISDAMKVSDELVRLKIVESKSELRRLQEQGAISSVLSGAKIENIDHANTQEVIRIGKHRFIQIEKA